MFQRSARGRFLEILLFTLSSLVLYHIGVGVVVFLIPLQALASRRGTGALLAACGGFLAVFLALRTFPFLGGTLPPDILSIVETLFVAGLLLGLVAAGIPGPGRTLHRLLAAAAVVGLASIPVGVWLSHSAAFQKAMGALFGEVSHMLMSLFGAKDGTADPAVASLLSPEALRRMSDAYLSRSLLAMYFLLLSFSWWAGQASASRSTWTGRPRFHFASFRLEGFWLWPLIASCALILADLFLGARGPGAGAGAVPPWRAGGTLVLLDAGWNAGLVLLILYALQGLAILRFLFEKHGLPRLLWVLLLVALAALAASPRAGVFVMLALPAFGVSENWIRYRVLGSREHNETP